MTDPLSLLTGVIGILSAAGQLSNGLQSLLVLRTAPAELLCLQKELDDFRLVVGNLNKLAAQDFGGTLALCDSSLDPLLVRAKEKWLEVEKLVAFTLTKANDGHKVRKSTWLLERNNVERHLKELRDIKASLSTNLLIISW